MHATRHLTRSYRAASSGICKRAINNNNPTTTTRFISTTVPRLFAADPKERIHSNAEDYRKTQLNKPENPHMTNTNSTISNQMPSVGEDKAPPELISHVDPDFVPKDSVPENTERMTGGTQKGGPKDGKNAELDVGEMEGVEVRIAPLKREGEDTTTMRARLLYQSRKRGILESDLLLSTFASTHLSTMPRPLLSQYDKFLDENDWDIYYWATQSPSDSPTSQETAEGAINTINTSNNKDLSASADSDPWRKGKPRSGEWAQTIGTFKPAYRPVPRRWAESEILGLLREHVRERRSKGELEGLEKGNMGRERMGEGRGNVEPKGIGMGRMPEVQVFD